MTYHSIDQLRPVVEFLIEDYNDNVNSFAKERMQQKDADYRISQSESGIRIRFYWTAEITKRGHSIETNDSFTVSPTDTHIELQAYVHDILGRICSTELENNYHAPSNPTLDLNP